MSSSRKNKEQALLSSQEAHEIQIANKLLDEMEKLMLNQSVSEKRWVWELLQNAKDVSIGETVNIEITLASDSLSFSHSGRPFQLKNLVFIIEQTSTKERATAENNPLTTGKFGTGFMTTHLLSKICELSGIFEKTEQGLATYQRFKMTLRRDAETQKEMIMKVKESFKVFEELDDEQITPYLENFQPSKNCDTTFKYIYGQDGLSVAKNGLKNLETTILTTMSFINEIGTVKIKNEIDKTVTTYQIVHVDCVDKNLKMLEFEVRFGESTKNHYILLAEAGAVSIAIDLEKNGSEYSLKDRAADKPVLYVDFPLLGSENFSLPVFVNSHKFNPDEPRSSLILKGNGPKSLENRRLFENCVPLIKILIEYLERTKVKNTHFLDDKYN